MGKHDDVTYIRGMFDFLKRKKNSPERAAERAAEAESARRLGADGPKGSRGTTGRSPLEGGQRFPPPTP